ncbi:MAG TPA: universal stress protein [Solirubrobacterales bacterium]|jgi:nucleotide-binding universal stress UspA family protein
MNSKVLIGFDGSPQGADALGLGRTISELLDARPLVATVISHPRHGVEESEFNEAVTSFCKPLFAEARRQLDGLDVQEKWMVDDSPAAGIYELTDWLKPTAIVIGSTRHGKSGRVQVGTVGGSLLSGVHSTVAVAPRGYVDRDTGFRRIGVAVDGGSESRRAVAAAAYLAERANAPLHIISVMGEPHYVLGGLLSPLGPEEYREYKEAEWEQIYQDAVTRTPNGVTTEPVLLHGHPADSLNEVASDLDLLVLGSRGYGPVKGTMVGSVSARVMAAAPCPVLVVPRGAGVTPLQA